MIPLQHINHYFSYVCVSSECQWSNMTPHFTRTDQIVNIGFHYVVVSKKWRYPQSSSILDWDFPWNKPSSDQGVPHDELETPIFPWLIHIFPIVFLWFFHTSTMTDGEKPPLRSLGSPWESPVALTPPRRWQRRQRIQRSLPGAAPSGILTKNHVKSQFCRRFQR